MDNPVQPHPRRRLIMAGAIVLVVAVVSLAAYLGFKNFARVGSSGSMVKRANISLGLTASAPQYAVAEDSAGGSVSYYKGGVPPTAPRPDYQTGGQTAAEVDQKIIKNGYLQLAVKDVSESIARIAASAGQKGGFVQNSSVTERADGTHFGQITVRIPAKDFESSMAEIKALAAVVRNESSTGQDVTEQYTDLEAQLRNAQAQELTYLSVLEKAKTVEDILNVQERLGQIRGVIESLQGRLKYLENVTAYSTINVNLEEEPVVRLPTKEFRPLSSVKEAAQALIQLAQQILVSLIWIIIVGGGILLPFALLALIVILIVKKLRRKA